MRALRALAVCTLVLVAACAPSRGAPPTAQPSSAASSAAAAPTQDAGPRERPNLVLVLLDDFSMDLVPTMRSMQKMARIGASYEQSYVVDSLCCVSRASLMTGQYPHQTRVFTNTEHPENPAAPLGGSEAFFEFGNDQRTVNLSLHESGYTTGFVGKYLNEYEAFGGIVPPIPPGWSDFEVLFGDAYDGWGFHTTETDGDIADQDSVSLDEYPVPFPNTTDKEKDAVYAGTVTANKALDFVAEHQGDEAPYFLEVAPYAPHSRVESLGAFPNEPFFPAAFRDRPRPGKPLGNCGRLSCDDLSVSSLPGFGPRSGGQPKSASIRDDGTQATWRPNNLVSVADAERTLRNRARMVQSADRMIRRILKKVDDNTVVMVTSDNGFHIGQFGTIEGKQSPYTIDAQVPLYITGPGVVPGPRLESANNLDIASTLEDLAGVKSPRFRSGRSLAPTLADPDRQRRDAVFMEHSLSPPDPNDPDALAGVGVSPVPSFIAIRTESALLVRFDVDPDWVGTDYAWEFYDYTTQPWERVNQFADPTYADEVASLRNRLEDFDACRSIELDAPVSKECRHLTSALRLVLPPLGNGHTLSRTTRRCLATLERH